MNFKNITTNELKKILNNKGKEEILLLDIRTKEEYDECKIDGAINIPLQDLLYEVDDLSDYKNKKIIVYCRSGHRSITACNLLSISGFDNLYNLEKGILDYRL